MRANSSSTWPLPSTPATPSTSPALIARRIDRQAADAQVVDGDDAAITRRAAASDRRQLLPDHLVGEAGAGACADRSRRADDDPVAQHGNAVGRLDDLAQTVGDQHDGSPVLGETAGDAEQAIRFGIGEHRRRLVEQEDLGIGVEGAQQFEALALTDRHRRHGRRRIDLEVEALGERLQVARRARPRPAPMALGAEQQQVLDGGHRRHEGEVLLHERHAALDRLSR